MKGKPKDINMYLNQLDLETLGSRLLLPKIMPDIGPQQELVGSHTGNSLDRPRRSQCASGILFWVLC